MKNTVAITLFFVTMILGSLNGQVSINVSAGINNTNTAFENFPDISTASRVGYFIGIAPGFQISEKIQILIDLQYSQKGHDLNANSVYAAGAFRFSYIDIIPEIEYRIWKAVHLGVGVNYAFKVDEETKYGEEGWSSISDAGIIKSSDFGISGKVKISHQNIFGFIRYNYGLSNIVDITFTDENGEAIQNVKQSNRNLQFGVGYTFSLGVK